MKIKNILTNLFKKKEEIYYPPEFALIDFSKSALGDNIIDEQNKIIYHYKYDILLDKFILKKYKYSKARFFALKEIRKIPVYDKTKFEIRFPVFARILPSEVEYSQG